MTTHGGTSLRSSLYPDRHDNYSDVRKSWTIASCQGSIDRVNFRFMMYDHRNYAWSMQNRNRDRRWRLRTRRFETEMESREVKEPAEKKKTSKGSVAGAIALIIGTSIGSGILALPIKTSPAGLWPSSISLTVCWAFLLIEALLVVEINVGLMNNKKKKFEGNEDELEVISIRTMAQNTLGNWGGILATFTYVFFGYSSMVAYCSKSGEIIGRLTNLPQPLSAFFFTVLFTILVAVGSTRTTDQINRWLTASMIGLLVGIEVLAFASGSGLSGLEDGGDWAKVPAAIPVMIFSLVFHDLAPVLCAYLGGDLGRIRASILVGSAVPLLALLAWNAIALGLFAQTNQLVTDPVDLLMRVRWSGVPLMVEAFSLLAVGTSIIGTLLSFSEFLKEEITNPTTWGEEIEEKGSFNQVKWWARRRSKMSSITATAIVVAPALFISTTFPDAFSTATNIAVMFKIKDSISGFGFESR